MWSVCDGYCEFGVREQDAEPKYSTAPGIVTRMLSVSGHVP